MEKVERTPVVKSFKCQTNDFDLGSSNKEPFEFE